MEALTVLRLCDRFHCLPSQLYAEDSELMRMIEIERVVSEDERQRSQDQDYG